MDTRKRPRKTITLALTIVFIFGAVLLAVAQTALAWHVTMLQATEPFSIGTDWRKYMESVDVAEPPWDAIQRVAIRLYWYDDKLSDEIEMTDGTIINKKYRMTVEITLKEGERFDDPENLEHLLQPFKHVSTSVINDHRVMYTLTADFTNYRIIYFDANGGKCKTRIKWIGVNSIMKPPEDPTRTGYTFDGWWTDATDGELFDFSKPIQNDVLLFARWGSPTQTTTTTTTTSVTTTEVITTAEETTTTAPTTVEETTSMLSESPTTVVQETSPTVTTSPVKTEPDAEEKPSLILIIAIVVGACLIGGLAGYLFYTMREKRRYR